MRDVRRIERKRLLDVGDCLIDGLTRQRPHQVEVEVVEAGILDRPDCCTRLIAIMDAAERVKL